MAQHRADGRAEHDAVLQARDKQGLNTQTVTAQDEPPLLFLPDSERENAIETLERIRVPFEKGVQQHLGVRMAAKSVTACE